MSGRSPHTPDGATERPRGHQPPTWRDTVDAGLDNAYDLARERYGDVKACSDCQRRLPIRMFNVKLRHKGVLQSRCRP